MRINNPKNSWLVDAAVAAAILMVGLVLSACAAAQPAAVTVTTDKAGNKAAVSTAGNKTIVDITSDTGIGNGVITATKNPAQPIVLQLHLKGLEQLQMAAGQSQVTYAVASQAPYDTRAEVGSGSTTSAIAPDSPYWAQVQIVTNGAKTIPLENGYFQLTVPNVLFRDGNGVVKFNWVDFMR